MVGWLMRTVGRWVWDACGSYFIGAAFGFLLFIAVT